MGGFTQVFLKEVSRENIDKHNARLELNKVPKKYRYYSEQDIILEYEAFLIGDGVFEERLFPRDKINSLEDFKKYWSPEALGEVFVPHVGTLRFDCYFGRTSKRAMRNIGRYLADNVRHIKKVSGSFSTFCERGMTKLEREIMKENGFLE
jgi:hypothetical protein